MQPAISLLVDFKLASASASTLSLGQELNTMEITEERFEDAGEKDADGYYDYYYSGVIYLIRGGGLYCKARTYDDEPDLVSILKLEIDHAHIAGANLFPKESHGNEFERESITKLLEALHAKGHQRIHILTSDGYQPIELSAP